MTRQGRHADEVPPHAAFSFCSAEGLSRRAFLATAALALAPQAVALPRRDRPSWLQLGLIGCGRAGLEHLNALRKERRRLRARIVAVCDVHRGRLDRARRLSGAVACHDWRELLTDPAIDGVIVAAPDHWHASMVLAALDAGKDVYCESPMALATDDSQKIVERVRATGRVVQIGVRRLAEGPWHEARRRVQSGALGEVRRAQSVLKSPSRGALLEPEPESPPTAGDVDWPAFLGGATMREFDVGRFLHWQSYWEYSRGRAWTQQCDELAAWLHVLGTARPTRVSAAGGIWVHDGRDTPDALLSQIECADGPVIALSSSWPEFTQSSILRGSKGFLELSDASVCVTDETRCEAITAETRHPLLADWLRGCRERIACLCPPELAHAAVSAMSRVAEAWRTCSTQEVA